MRYRFFTKVKRVEERTRAKRAYKIDPNDPNSEIIVEREPLGWFVVLEGSWEALHIGDQKPDLNVGDHVSVTLERAFEMEGT